MNLTGVLDKVNKPLVAIESGLKNVKKDRDRNQFLVTKQKTADFLLDVKKSSSIKVTGKFHGSCCLICIFSKEIAEKMINEKTIICINEKEYRYNLPYKKKVIQFKLEIGRKYLWRRRDVRRNKIVPNGWLRTGKESFNHNIGFLIVTEFDTEKPYRNIYNETNVLIKKNETFVSEVLPIESLDCGTYELCGPMMQNNVHQFDKNILVPHGIYNLKNKILNSLIDENLTVDLENIKDWLLNSEEGILFEGIVIHMEIGNIMKFYKIHRGHLGLGSFSSANKFNILKN